MQFNQINLITRLAMVLATILTVQLRSVADTRDSAYISDGYRCRSHTPSIDRGESNLDVEVPDSYDEHYVIERLDTLPQENITFLIGQNCSTAHEGDVSGEVNVNAQLHLRVIGFMDGGGNPQGITPGDLKELLQHDLRPDLQAVENTGQLNNPEGDRLFILSVDLLAVEARTNQTYLIPGVSIESIKKDAIIAILANRVSTVSLDFSQLDFDEVIRFGSQDAQSI